ncbi:MULTISPECIES: hypothetical protein [unclassified Lysobacter]|uniref:ExbD/TolR family protein n=1 Tax=unclassified Lysobacter TaxID=2635362 RepID=UPI0006F5249A|nr:MULTISPECIES: hypothetical protein [unclassified Lysobacter]KRC32053.1 hypothetical protein ASE10_15970 [Lysobacter sp. Root76]KRD67516.1 hypothetical protein ASE45_12145 [Lysobacter sp. Root96]
MPLSRLRPALVWGSLLLAASVLGACDAGHTVDVDLPKTTAPAADGATASRILYLLDDGRVYSPQGPVELPLAIRALGPPATTEVILQGCKADLDYRYIAFALRTLKAAGYERITLKGGGGHCG